jgi:hypothetical protein
MKKEKAIQMINPVPADTHWLIVKHSTDIAVRDAFRKAGYCFPKDETGVDEISMLTSKFTEEVEHDPLAKTSATVVTRRKNKRAIISVVISFDPLFDPQSVSGFIKVVVCPILA